MKQATQKELEDFVNREVYECQNYLVNELINKNFFRCSDIDNYCKTEKELRDEGYSNKDIERAMNNGENIKKIYQWWIVSDWLINELKKKGEPILSNEYGDWWGRITIGEAIELDNVIKDIYNDLHKND